jgi:GTP-binding protein
LSSATFIKSAASPNDFPGDVGREIAIVGRSNSGKSTALNVLVGARKLARVSKTPGRTQLINFFAIGPERRLVDLPGYGFAQVTPEVRERWDRLIGAYFEGRRSLAGVLITVDIRRGIGELDARMLGWLGDLRIPAAVLLTKADKLGRGAGNEQLRAVRARVGPDTTVVRFSAITREGVAEAQQWVDARLATGSAEESP